MDYNAIFSKNIKYVRNLRGLMQEEVSKVCGFKRGKYASYEQMVATPSPDAVVKICRALSIQNIGAALTQDFEDQQLRVFEVKRSERENLALEIAYTLLTHKFEC